MPISPEYRRKVLEAVRGRYRSFLNTIWGHIIYKPAIRARWKIPYGMKTLEQFVKWHESMGITQKRSDHPIALEIYFSIVLPRLLTKREVTIIITDLTEELFNEFYETLIDLMEWGHDYEPVGRELAGFFESKKRYSRDGEDFFEENITSRMEKTRRRLI